MLIMGSISVRWRLVYYIQVAIILNIITYYGLDITPGYHNVLLIVHLPYIPARSVVVLLSCICEVSHFADINYKTTKNCATKNYDVSVLVITQQLIWSYSYSSQTISSSFHPSVWNLHPPQVSDYHLLFHSCILLLLPFAISHPWALLQCRKMGQFPTSCHH